MRILSLALLGSLFFAALSWAQETPKTRKIVLIAGAPDKGHPPGTHEYEKSVKLLKYCLENSANVRGLKVEAHLRGWPEKASTLDDADTIVLVASGSDRNLTDHPLLVKDRLAVIEKQMKRGCGLALIHWSTFFPNEPAGKKVLDWVGGYFDYQSGPASNGWYSKIQTVTVQATPVPHAVTRGLKPFEVKDEFYYNLRFRDRDSRLIPFLKVPMGKEGDHTVAWGVERADGGRGFGFTGGHFFDNWRNESFRRLVLNAILWTAHVEVPAEGVKSEAPGDREINLVTVGTPSQVLILTGHDGPFHNWRETSQTLKHVIERDGRLRCRIVDDPEYLATGDLQAYDLIVQNYVNWERKGLSDAAKKNLLNYLQSGRGLAVIHFANGAFHFSLPGAKESDWPEYRKIVPRVWDHTKGLSGHDPYGKFRVEIANSKHPITAGLEAFDTVDELYYRQQGDQPVEVLATARSKDTGKEEPIAWVSQYGKARIFQTLLGHSADSIRGDGAAALIRRASVWAAGRELRPEPAVAAAKPKLIFSEGKFDKALDARLSPANIEGDDRYRTPPLTVECWARLFSKNQFNVVISCDPKSSSRHWELYSYAGSGAFSAYLPGTQQGEIRSDVNICDGQWHYLAMTHDGKKVSLFVDGKKVKEQEITLRPEAKPESGPILIGAAYVGETVVGCDGLVDDVRISNIIRPITGMPTVRAERDSQTISLWNLDGSEGISADTNWTPPAALAGEPWERMTDKDWVDARFQQTDTGPSMNATIDFEGAGGKVRIYKATAVRLGDKGTAIYDRSTMQFAAGWTNGYLNHSSRRFGLLNTPTPATGAKMVIANPAGPGWANGEGSFDAGRPSFTSPLPKDWVRYRGLYLNGNRTTLSYSVGSTEVLETPEELTIGDVPLIVRTIQVGPSNRSETLLLGQLPANAAYHGSNKSAQWVGTNLPTKETEWIGVVRQTSNATMKEAKGIVTLTLPPSKESRDFQVVYTRGAKLDSGLVESMLARMPKAPWPTKLTEPGPARWTKPVTSMLELGSNTDQPFTIDTLALPYSNPWNALFFVSGVDFLPSGEVAICTAHGDVWLVSQKTATLQWKRYATGLYQPLGLKVVDGKIVVVERGQLTRLHDNNNDGEADFYENLNSDWHAGGGEHSYDTCLETDPEGNFYFFKTGDDHTPTGGCLLKVSKDGSKMEIFATGFRHPIGLGMSPKGVVSGADQEGNWMPSTRLDLYKQGGFYGDMRTHHRQVPPKIYDEPLLWLPKEADNSAGGQVWIPEGQWGTLGGRMIHLSYGRCRAYAILPDGDRFQAAAVDLGLKFLSGAARARFNNSDSSLYVVGLNGWQTGAQKDGSLQRVRYLKKSYPFPVGFATATNQVELNFDEPLASVIAPGAFQVERWNYRWGAEYGSKPWSVADAKREGRDEVKVESVRVSSDGKKLTLTLSDLRPAMQYRLRYTLPTTTGETLKGVVYSTIHTP